MKFNITKEGYVSCLVISAEKLDSKVAPDLKSQFIVLPKAEDIVDVVIGQPSPTSDIIPILQSLTTEV